MRFALFAIKNVIGAEVNELRVFIATNLGQDTRRFGIDPKGLFALRLAKIDIGKGGGVNHKIDIERAKLFAQLPMIGEIKLRVVETGHVKFSPIFAHQRSAETATRTEDCDFHAVVAAAVSGGRTSKLPVRTLAATTRRTKNIP